MDLNDILSDKPVPALEPEKDEKSAELEVPPKEEAKAPAEPAAPSAAKAEEPAKEPEKVEAEEPAAREDKGRFVKTVPQEALHAERERRRELEAQLEELKKTQNPPKAPTSVLEDEDKAFKERLTQATAPLVQKFFALSVAHARRVPGREDYQQVYDFLNDEVKRDPSLMKQIDDAEDPGEFIYQLGKIRKELSEVGGDLTKYREHATAKVRTELEQTKAALKAAQAELDAVKKSQEKRSQIPQSLNSEASAVPKGEQFAGPTPLKSILN